MSRRSEAILELDRLAEVGLRRMPNQTWHLARLGRSPGTLVPFPSFCHPSTFFLSSSGGGLPGRLATLTESRRPFYFVRCFVLREGLRTRSDGSKLYIG